MVFKEDNLWTIGRGTHLKYVLLFLSRGTHGGPLPYWGPLGKGGFMCLLRGGPQGGAPNGLTVDGIDEKMRRRQQRGGDLQIHTIIHL